MNRYDLLKELTMLDFMATDIHLYLDTHPFDKAAIKKYNNVIAKADECRYKYEKTYGPLCSYRSMSKEDYWAWINDPWPWYEDFNENPGIQPRKEG